MTDQFQFWRRSLAGERLEVEPGHPQSGYYRTRDYQPVAIWRVGRTLHCLKGTHEILHADEINDLFGFVCRSPISFEQYEDALDGKPWPHEVPGLGSNRPPDGFEMLRDEIEEICRIAFQERQAGSPGNQTAADRLANVAAKLQDLISHANDLRRKEKQPFEKTLQAIESRWSSIIDDAEAEKKCLKGLIGEWLKASGARTAGQAGKVALRSHKRITVTDPIACASYFAESETLLDCLVKLSRKAVIAGQSVPGITVSIEETAA